MTLRRDSKDLLLMDLLLLQLLMLLKLRLMLSRRICLLICSAISSIAAQGCSILRNA